MAESRAIFLGRFLHTDDEKLHSHLIQIMDDIKAGREPIPTNWEEFEREFPGVKEAAIEAIKDLDSKRLRAYRLVYFNGVMQAWCMPGFGDETTGLPHPPSKLCPNNKLYPVESR